VRVQAAEAVNRAGEPYVVFARVARSADHRAKDTWNVNVGENRIHERERDQDAFNP
jgi:hypothetical protein